MIVLRSRVHRSLAGAAGLLTALACVLALGAGGASGATAHGARTLVLSESGRLHLTSHHGFHLNEQGTASGTIRGSIYIHLYVQLDQPGDGRSQHLSEQRLADGLWERELPLEWPAGDVLGDDVDLAGDRELCGGACFEPQLQWHDPAFERRHDRARQRPAVAVGRRFGEETARHAP